MDDWTINLHCNVSVDQIKQIVTAIKDLQKQQIAQDSLVQLTSNGIRKYMNKWFMKKSKHK